MVAFNLTPIGTEPEPEPEPEPTEPEPEEDVDDPDDERTFKPPMTKGTLAEDLFNAENAAFKFERLARPWEEQGMSSGARREIERLGLPAGTWSISDPQAVAFLAQKDRTYWRGKIVQTTINDITLAVQTGVVEGEGARQIAKRIEGVFDSATRSRSLRIARTETVGAYNEGGTQADENGGATHKEWITVLDDTTRDDHADADGQEVEIRDTYLVGGDQLRYPGDPGGSTEQIVNCRCTSAGVIKDRRGIAPEHKARDKAFIIEHVLREQAIVERGFRRAIAREFRREEREVLRNLRRLLG